MTAFDDVRRKRTTVMAAASLAVLLAVGGLAYAGVKALRRYEGATKVGNESIAFPSTPVGLLATVNADNVLTSLTVMVLQPNAAPGGSLVSVPVSTDSTLGFGDVRTPFTEVYATGGAEALTLAVESALSITFDVSQVADPTAAAALLAPVGQITVNLSSSAGTDFPVGSNTLTPEQAVQVLNFTEAGQPDRSRRADVEAVWEGVATAVGAGLPTSGAATGSTVAGGPITFGSLVDLFGVLLSGPVGARPLPADLIPAEKNPDGKDVEHLDQVDALIVLASIAPRSMSAPAPGLVYRIEAPAGYEVQMRVAVALVLFAGGNVQSVYLNAPRSENTQVLVGDERLRSQTGVSDGLFGPTDVGAPDTKIEGVDVILRLGTTWLDSAISLQTPTTTSTTTAAPSGTDPSASTSSTTA